MACGKFVYRAHGHDNPSMFAINHFPTFSNIFSPQLIENVSEHSEFDCMQVAKESSCSNSSAVKEPISLFPHLKKARGTTSTEHAISLQSKVFF